MRKAVRASCYLIVVFSVWIARLIWDLPAFESGKESIFDYALETYSVGFWSGAFFWSSMVLLFGLLTKRTGFKIGGLVLLMMIYLCWGLVLLFSALRPEVFTTGYPLCSIMVSALCALCAFHYGQTREGR